MSELKDRWFWAYPTESVDCDGITGSAHEVYSKSETDKVIAELESDYKEACGRLQTANLIKDEQLAATRRQKYKRCLAMARWCATERDIYHLIPQFGKMKFYTKWRKRWLELAEKFKEVS